MGTENNRNKLNAQMRKTAGPYFGITDKTNLIKQILDPIPKPDLADISAFKSAEDYKNSLDDSTAQLATFDSLIEDLIQGTDGSLPMCGFSIPPKEEGGTATDVKGFIQGFAEKMTTGTPNKDSVDVMLSDGPYGQIARGEVFRVVGNWQKNPGTKEAADTLPIVCSPNSLYSVVYDGNTSDTKTIEAEFNPPIPDRNNPSISVVEMLDDFVCRSSQDSSLVQLFANGIPSIELAQCVPYLDVRIMDSTNPATVPGDAEGVYKVGSGLSAVKFIKGFGDLEPQDSEFLNALPSDAVLPPLDKDPDAPVPVRPSIAGMELFTMPQTFTGPNNVYIDSQSTGGKIPEGRPNPILKPFQPLMTITNFDYKVESANAVMSTLRGTLSLVLHDRSRLHEIAALMRPDKTAGLEILVEWGWSHPGDPEESLYAGVLNACRTKRKFIVSTSSYSFQSNGSVNITLNMFAKGNSTIALDLVSAAIAPNTQDELEKLAKDLGGHIKQNTEVSGLSAKDQSMSLFQNKALGRFTSVGSLLTIPPDELKELKKKITNRQSWSKKASTASFEELQKLIIAAVEKVGEYRTAVSAAFKDMDNSVEFKQDPSDTSPKNADPFRSKWLEIQEGFYNAGAKKNADGTNGLTACKFDDNNHISFGRLVSIYIIPQLRIKGAWEDIQVIFYPANKSSYGYSKFDSLAQIPINIKRWKARWEVFRQTQINPSLLQFLSMTINFIEQDRAGGGYGLGGAFVSSYNTKTKVYESKKADGKSGFPYGRRLANAAQKIYKSPKRFKQPKIKIDIETIPIATDETQSILRLHIYDGSRDMYSSYTDFLRQASNESMGIIAKSTQSDPKTAGLASAEKQFGKLADLGFLKEIDVADIPSGAGNLAANADYVNGTAYYRTMKSPGEMKYFLSQFLPTLKYGTEYSIMTSVGVAAQPDGALSLIQLKKRQKGGTSAAPGNEAEPFPLQLFPVQLTVETIGCPFFRHGQQFFFDFQTNTDIDNIYILTGIDHKISSGKFSTSLRLSRTDRYGFFETLEQKLTEMQVIAAEGASQK